MNGSAQTAAFLAVWSRAFVERVKFESFRLASPCFADELVRGEALEGLEPSCEVVGVDEVPQMRAQLIVGFVEVAFDGGVLNRPVHSLNLTIRPWMLRLRQPVVDIVEGAGIFEGMCSEGFLLGDHLPDFHWRPGVASGIGEVGSVVGKDRVDLVRDGLDQSTEEVCGVAPRDRLAEFDKGELRGPVDGDEEIEFAFGGSNLGNIDVELSNRISLELPLRRRFPSTSGSLEIPWRRKQRCKDERVRCGIVG